MFGTTVLFALVAALCNALNITAQHLGSLSSAAKSAGWRFIPALLSNPMWLAGWCALAGGFLFQALALHDGRVSVVQPLLVTEIVFALALRRVWLRQSVRAITWLAAAATCVSLSVFLAVSEPEGGAHYAGSHNWAAGTWGAVGAAAVLGLAGWGSAAGRRTALLASSSAIMWALVALLVKAMTDTWSQFGVLGMFGHWPVYALAAAGLATEIVHQATLRLGPLSIAQPLLVVINPVVSIALSVAIFREHFTPDVLRLAVGSAAFAGMCMSAAVLTRTAPATMSKGT